MILKQILFRVRLPPPESLCLSCRLRLSKASIRFSRHPFTTSTYGLSRASQSSRKVKRTSFRREYFSANGIINLPPVEAASPIKCHVQSKDTPTSLHSELVFKPPDPGTRALNTNPVFPKSLPRPPDSSPIPNPVQIPPDASSRLTTFSTQQRTPLRRLLPLYLSLSKPRLTFLILLTTTSAYSLYPVPPLLHPLATASPSLSTLTLLFLTTGTALCCASANTLNMLFEPTHDAKMQRTRNRPLVRGLISKKGAVIFAILTSIGGIAGLYYGVNPTVSFLGASNIVLYAFVYTPLKRLSVLNTWVGAVVGGIPPLMGWAAAAGQVSTASAPNEAEWKQLLFSEGSTGGWCLAALLFAWQFPHFNALSWSIRHEYAAAGYRMLASINPAMNARVALRYSLLFFPICGGLTYCGVTDRGFLATSSVVNAWLVREAYRFWKLQGEKGTAKRLFWAGVWQLPVVMVLAMGHKKGLWDGVLERVFGRVEEYDADDEMEKRRIRKPVGALQPARSVRQGTSS